MTAEAPPVRVGSPDRLAANIYTSGSTGRPKAVALTHGNVLSTVVGRRAYPAPERLLLPVSFAFDVFLSFAAWTLCEGGTLVIPVQPHGTDIDELADLMRTHRVTHLVGPPHLHQVLLGRRDIWVSDLVLAIAGGESCPRALAEEYHRAAPGARLVNEYGPTEASWGTYFNGVESAGPHLPIGRPPVDYRVHVLDDDLSPVIPGSIGELHVGGAGVARGYRDNPALTAERFLPDPFAGESGARLYRTGDFGRLRADGELEFLGRRDQQVKVRGLRIELGEVEANLARHPEVVVAAVRQGEDQDLVAYAVAADQARPSIEDMRAFLSQSLPDPMVPTTFVWLDRLPLTPHGKVDRTALAAIAPPAAARPQTRAPNALRTPAEKTIAEVWADVLGVPDVDIHADFFESGGHSLLAATVISRLRALYPVAIGLRDLFQARTVAGLAEVVGARVVESVRGQFGERITDTRAPAVPDGSAPKETSMVATPHDGAVPLSPSQRQLWLLDQTQAGSTEYQVSAATRLRGPLNVEALRRAFGAIIARHEILRTRIALVDDEPVQIVDPPKNAALPVIVADGRDLDDLLAELAARPFDLSRDLPIHASLVRFATDDHLLVVSLHHITFDARSVELLWKELDELYTAETAGRPARLSPLPIQYADYAIWEQRSAPTDHLAYWRSQLRGVAPLPFPTDRPAPTMPDHRGRAVTFTLDAVVGADVRALAGQHSATPFIVLLTAFTALLARYCGSTDIAVGTPVWGRGRPEIDDLIGYFGNTLVLRTDVSGRPSFAELVDRARQTTVDALAQQDVSIADIVDSLAPHRPLPGNPLCNVMFAYAHEQDRARRLGDLEVAEYPLPVRTVPVDLHLRLTEQTDGTIEGELRYATALFVEETATDVCDRFAYLLRAALRRPGLAVDHLPLADGHGPLALSSLHGPVEAEPDRCLHELVDEQAVATPDAVAVVMGGQLLTYQEVQALSDAMAADLRAQGVGPESVVAVCLPRCPQLPAALLGILKAGASYLPLDPAHPPERNAAAVRSVGAAVVLTRADLPGAPASPSAPRMHPDNAAYAIFTSGSTGEPKCVVVPHRGLVNRVLWTVRRHRLTAADRVLQKTTVAFDAAGWEIFAPLVSGGTVVLATLGAEHDPALLVADMLRHDVTILQAVPALWQLIAAEPRLAECRSLRLLFSAGEPLTADLCARLTDRLNAQLFNTYGPTECSIDATAWEYQPEGLSGSLAPIGGPLDNIAVQLVDDALQPVPVGVPGELCVTGAGVARGYRDSPALTATRFVPDPLAGTPGARMYRTGDRARQRRDGTLEFLGRLDDQLKIRGVRVEPAEVAAVLERHPAVAAAAVLGSTDTRGDKALVGYVVGRESTQLTTRELLDYAARLLPVQLLPTDIVFLDALPRTASGKIDRRALAAVRPRPAPMDFIAVANGSTEDDVFAIWAGVLGRPDFGQDDDFFATGGNSLVAIRMMVRLRARFGLDLPVSVLYEERTARRVAARISLAAAGGGMESTSPPEPVGRDVPLPLSAAQERLWLAERMSPGAYLGPIALRLTGGLDRRALAEALTAITARHEILRTRYVLVRGEPRQVVDPSAPVALTFVDIADRPDADTTAAELVRTNSSRPFDLSQEVPFRVVLIRVRDGEHVLLVLTHHIACDGWSLDLLADELAEVYGALVEGRKPTVPALPIQYADYAVWQRRQSSADHIDYWRDRLAHVVPADLPIDRPRPPVRSYDGAVVTVDIPAPVADALLRLGRARNATPFMTFLAAFTATLARYTDRPWVAAATPVAGRDHSTVESLVGCFINTLVLATDVSGDPAFGELVDRTRATVLEAFDRGDTPFERLVKELAPQRDLARSPFTEVMFQLRDVARTPFRLAGLDVARFPFGWRAAAFDLTLSVSGLPDGSYEVEVEYATALFDRATVLRLAHQFQRLVDAVAANPSAALSTIALDAPSAPGSTEPTPYRSVPETIAGWAAVTPDATAVLFGDTTLRYAELEVMVGRVAAELAGLGVRPGDRVAVCLDRGPALVATLLGVLRVRGVYAPIDPNDPVERVYGLLADLRPAAAVTQERLANRFVGVPTLAVERLGVETKRVVPIGPDELAYVIYTSGSTGQPKGVMVDHAAFAHHCRVIAAAYELDPSDRWALMASATFDASLDQIAATLVAGATVVVLDPATTGPDRLAEELSAYRVTVVDLTPAHYRNMVTSLSRVAGLDSLRLLSVGGDTVSYADARRWASTGLPARFAVTYGPTEATIACTMHTLTTEELAADGPDGTVPIGRPLPGTGAYVLDADLRPVPDGAAGELCLGGRRVARGYLGGPDLTADRFVPDPFADRAGARMYRSGDLVRRRTDGELDFLGRTDNQVKIRGFRVEPGEIEAVIATHPAVRSATVIAARPESGERRLVAYVVAASDHHAPAPRELAKHLRARLPDYMLPSTWMVLPRLPLTVNGKVDSAALPPPDWTRSTTAGQYREPANPAEHAICSILADVLALDRVGRHDDFFDIGGDSLVATHLLLRMQEAFGVEIDLRTLFAVRTPALLAEAVEDLIVNEVDRMPDERVVAAYEEGILP